MSNGSAGDRVGGCSVALRDIWRRQRDRPPRRRRRPASQLAVPQSIGLRILRGHCLNHRTAVQACRKVHQRLEVAVVGNLQGVNVVVAVMAGDDNRQVIVFHEVPGDEGARYAAVAVGEGVYLHEAVMKPRGDQQRVVLVGLAPRIRGTR